MPVTGIIRLPLVAVAMGMLLFRNDCSRCDLYTAAQTIGVARVAVLRLCGVNFIANLCAAVMVVRVNFTVFLTAIAAHSFGMTGCRSVMHMGHAMKICIIFNVFAIVGKIEQICLSPKRRVFKMYRVC